MQAKTENVINISNLPRDMKNYIFSFMNDKQLVSMKRTNKFFNEKVTDYCYTKQIHFTEEPGQEYWAVVEVPEHYYSAGTNSFYDKNIRNILDDKNSTYMLFKKRQDANDFIVNQQNEGKYCILVQCSIKNINLPKFSKIYKRPTPSNDGFYTYLKSTKERLNSGDIFFQDTKIIDVEKSTRNRQYAAYTIIATGMLPFAIAALLTVSEVCVAISLAVALFSICFGLSYMQATDDQKNKIFSIG